MRLATDDADQMSDLAAHVAECDVCAETLARLGATASLLRATSAGGAESAACLDDEAVMAMTGGVLDPAIRGSMLDHVATCAACRRRLASTARVLNDPAVVRAQSEAEQSHKRSHVVRRLGPAIGLAAAAVVLIIAVPRLRDEPAPDAHRSTPITASAAPRAVAPAGMVIRPATFRWTRVPGADQYRLIVFAASGSVVFETEVADTMVAAPDTVRFTDGGRYLWKVEARTGWQRWSSSEPAEFTVTAGRKP
jgi:hypothetical protein